MAATSAVMWVETVSTQIVGFDYLYSVTNRPASEILTSKQSVVTTTTDACPAQLSTSW